MSKPVLLITGGAGYIGSHTARLGVQKGYEIVVLDRVSPPDSYPREGICFYQGDCGDELILDRIFKTHAIEAVMHFAAYIQVGESVHDPLKYYVNNVVKTIRLLELMLTHGVKTFIFSSTAAVYGNPQKATLDEGHPKQPVSPYGAGKLMVETVVQDLARAYNLAYVGLRFFNAAGACPEDGLGEHHIPETHLIPLLLQASIQRAPFTIFGTDYPTPDGTCIRDYVHVLDIAQAHYSALSYLKEGKPSTCFNLGMGKGFSVNEVISVVERVTRKNLIIQTGPRRLGDPAVLVADIDKARTLLRWEPVHTDLEGIVETAYASFASGAYWHKTNSLRGWLRE